MLSCTRMDFRAGLFRRSSSLSSPFLWGQEPLGSNTTVAQEGEQQDQADDNLKLQCSHLHSHSSAVTILGLRPYYELVDDPKISEQ